LTRRLPTSEAIRIDPKYDVAYYNRGLDLEKKQQLREALSHFIRYSELDPSDADGARAVKRVTAALDASTSPPPTTAAGPTPATAVTPGRRVALVIGNTAYRHAPALQNPGNDAQLLAATLRDAGFASVSVKSDLTREQMALALREFARESDTADWVAVYYSGHGIEFGGTNYMIPVDAQLKAGALEHLPHGLHAAVRRFGRVNLAVPQNFNGVRSHQTQRHIPEEARRAGVGRFVVGVFKNLAAHALGARIKPFVVCALTELSREFPECSSRLPFPQVALANRLRCGARLTFDDSCRRPDHCPAAAEPTGSASWRHR
jgi:tetratricopeptide (TPR) repeat protein